MPKEAASLFVRLSLAAKDFKKDILKSTRDIGQLGSALSGLGQGASIIAAPLAIAGAASVKLASDLDSALTRSTSLNEDFASKQAELSAAARKTALETGIAADKVGEAFFFLASAGKDAERSLKLLPAVTRFATAGQFDLAVATDLATDAQSALGLTSQDAQQDLENLVRVTDTLVEANTLANATVQQFSEALTNKAGAAIKSVGKDIEEGVAVLAALADQGVKGVDAGTKLGIVFRDLQTKAIQNKAAFKSLGIEVFDAHGEMNNLADIVEDVEKALAGMSDETQKATLLQLGFADKSVSTLQALLGTSEAIRRYETSMREMSGTTERVSDAVLKKFENVLLRLKAALADVGIELGEALMPAIRDFSGFIKEDVLPVAKDAVEIFKSLPLALQKILIAALAAGPAILALSVGINVLASALKALAFLLPLITTPLGLIATVVVGAAAGLGLFAAVTSRAAEQAKELGDQLRKAKEDYLAFDEAIAGAQEFAKLPEEIRRAHEELGRLEAALNAAEVAGNKNTIAAIKNRIEVVKASIAHMELARTLKAAGEAAEEESQATERASGNLALFIQRMTLFEANMRDALTTTALFSEAQDDAARHSELLQAAIAQTKDELQQLIDQGREEGKLAEAVLSEPEAIFLQDRLGRLREELLLFEDQQRQTVQNMSGAWGRWREEMREIFDGMTNDLMLWKNLGAQAIQDFSSSFGNSLAQTIVFQRKFGRAMAESMKQLAAQFIARLISMGAQMLIFKVLSVETYRSQAQSSIFSSAGEAYSAGFSSVMKALPWPINVAVAPGVAAGAAAQTLFGLSYLPLTAFAEGGIVTKPTAALIGEAAEPEVVSPLSALRRMLGREDGMDQELVVMLDSGVLARAVVPQIPGEVLLHVRDL